MPRLLLLALLSLALTACFKPEIRQGNFLEQDKIAQLKMGMTRQQVVFIMGRPMIQDPFHQDRWDYVRWVNPNDGSPIENWRVTVFFKDNNLARIDQPPPQNQNTKLQLPTIDDLTPLPQPGQNGQQGGGGPSGTR